MKIRIAAAMTLLVSAAIGAWIATRPVSVQPSTVESPGVATPRTEERVTGGASPQSPLPTAVSQVAALMSLSPQALQRSRDELRRLDAEYDKNLGISIPDSYRAINDVQRLRNMMAGGDRFAAAQLAQILLSQGDFSSAADAYTRAAELGSPAALSELAMMLEPGRNSTRDYLNQSLGRVPEADAKRAYISAQVAYLRGQQEAFFLLDRLRRQARPGDLAAWNAGAAMEYTRLAELYRSRYGQYPTAQINPTELLRNLEVFQANFVPREAATPGGR